MCGRLNVIDNPALISLCETLGIEFYGAQQRFGRFMRATNTISIVRYAAQTMRMDNATWWLLLEPTEDNFKPSKYTSFNTRYDKLNTPRSAGYQAFRQSRCVIPVVGFGESEFKNKKPLHYHDFTAKSGAMLLAGLYREWVHHKTAEVRLSCSVITVPPHHKLQVYHSKSSPMMLPNDNAVIAKWLGLEPCSLAEINAMVKPVIYQDLLVHQIDKPSTHNQIGETVNIEAD